jgi:hypothetical protein
VRARALTLLSATICVAVVGLFIAAALLAQANHDAGYCRGGIAACDDTLDALQVAIAFLTSVLVAVSAVALTRFRNRANQIVGAATFCVVALVFFLGDSFHVYPLEIGIGPIYEAQLEIFWAFCVVWGALLRRWGALFLVLFPLAVGVVFPNPQDLTEGPYLIHGVVFLTPTLFALLGIGVLVGKGLQRADIAKPRKELLATSAIRRPFLVGFVLGAVVVGSTTALAIAVTAGGEPSLAEEPIIATMELATDEEAQSAVLDARLGLEAYAREHGSYADITLADLEGSVSPSRVDALTIETGEATYRVTAAVADTGNFYSIERTSDGDVIRTCGEDGYGDCPLSGNW